MQHPEDRIQDEYNKKMQKNEEKLLALERRRNNIEKKRTPYPLSTESLSFI